MLDGDLPQGFERASPPAPRESRSLIMVCPLTHIPLAFAHALWCVSFVSAESWNRQADNVLSPRLVCGWCPYAPLRAVHIVLVVE